MDDASANTNYLVESLDWMRPILLQWPENIDRYLNSKGGKHIPPVPYAGTERANISLLAGATWQSGGVALEEFTINRGEPGNPRWGRSDLWIALGNNSLAVEAKQSWQVNRGYQNIKQKLKQAVEDVGRVPHQRNTLQLGLVFVTVKISETQAEKKDIGDIVRERTQWVKQYGDEFDMFAEYFPFLHHNERSKFADTSGRQWFWPGIYMIG